MATPVEVPKLGNTVEECIVAKWCKRKGDRVSAGDIIAEIETDKTTFEVAAPESGTLLETFFEEGAIVPVFTNLFVIGEPGEESEAFRPQSIVHSVPAAGAECSGALSPRARRFARDNDFHPESITGSGPGGRVLEQDLKQAFNSHGRIREKIARRMRESLASTAQYTLNAWADASALIALRARIRNSAEAPDININHLVTFCAIQALLDMPALNAEFIDGKIHRHSEVHLGFACDTPRGLIAPVVRNAHKLTIRELAIRMKELTVQAVQETIPADSLSGATFTITNLGGLGIDTFTPILNPPQVAILGVGALHIKPVRREGRVEFVDAIGLSLTCDHQVIDGAPGARFLAILRDKLEKLDA